MSTPPLQLAQDLLQQVRAHGEETYPDECCGILLGRAGEETVEVSALLRAGNTRTDSAHNRYHIDPRELIAAQREARRLRLDIVGFYHSLTTAVYTSSTGHTLQDTRSSSEIITSKTMRIWATMVAVFQPGVS